MGVRNRNTLERGIVRFIIFRENDEWFGVVLEFGIVVNEGNAEAVYHNLNEATKGYLESLQKSKVRPTTANPLLNQTADSEYEDLWNRLQNGEPIPSPIQVHSSGTLLTQ